MKTRFLGILIWLLFFGFVLVGGFGLNLTKVQAAGTPPVTMATINPVSPNGTNGWYNTVPTVTLNATDTESDIDKTYYKWHETDIDSEYTVGEILDVPVGSHTLSYYSTDVVGNVETVQQTAVFQVDIVAPVTTAEGIDATVALSATDTGDMGSGVNKIYYHWDSDADQEYLSALTVAEGSHILVYYSIDDAGNIEDFKSKTFKVDTTHPAAPILNIIVNDNNQVQLSWNAVIDADHYDIYRDGKLIATLWNGQVSYVDQQIMTGKKYTYKIVAVDVAGNKSQPSTASIFVPKPVIITPIITPVQIEPVVPVVINPVVEKKIGTGISTSVAQTAPEPTVTPQVQGESKVIDTPKDTESAPEESRNWNKLLLIISILIIAAGVATGGYYGYEWYMNRKDDGTGDSNPKNKSRW